MTRSVGCLALASFAALTGLGLAVLLVFLPIFTWRVNVGGFGSLTHLVSGSLGGFVATIIRCLTLGGFTVLRGLRSSDSGVSKTGFSRCASVGGSRVFLTDLELPFPGCFETTRFGRARLVPFKPGGSEFSSSRSFGQFGCEVELLEDERKDQVS